MFIFHLRLRLDRKSGLGVIAKPEQVEYGGVKKR